MKRKTHISTTVYVVGAGQFPLDMLRYDSCVPASQDDVHKMTYGASPRLVTLKMFTEDGRGPEQERWASFMWRVVDERLARAVGFANDPDAALRQLIRTGVL